MSIEIAIYGASGFGREVAWLVETTREDEYRVVCFIDDDPSKHGQLLNEIPVMSLEDAYSKFPSARVVGGVGSPQIREKLMTKASAVGFGFQTIIHHNVERSKWISYGEGTLICAGNILTTNITLGRHVQINLDCTLGHDIIMDDFATLAPGVHVSGCVHVGKRAYIGTGAVIINGTQEQPIIIGDDVVIGAGACVVGNVEAGQTVVGVPAKPLVRRS